MTISFRNGYIFYSKNGQTYISNSCDVNKCRSLSSNKGYIEGRSEYISQKKSENGRTDKKLTISDSELTKNEEEMTDSEVDSSYIF